MAKYEFASDEFNRAAYEAGHKAFLETLAAGVSVFYRDEDGLNVMEQPDGRRFEIRFILGTSDHEIVREVEPRRRDYEWQRYGVRPPAV